MFGALCVLAAAWLLLVSTRGALDEERAFRAAVGCAADGDGDGDDDCLRTVAARIDRTERETGRKTPRYRLYVVEADGTTHRTHLKGSPQDHPVARAGAGVEVTYWRGRIRYVDIASVRRYTTADPRGDYKIFCAAGLALGVYGTVFLWCGFWSTKVSHASVRMNTWQIGVPVSGGLGLAAIGAVAPFPTDSPGAAFRLVALSVPVVVAVCSVAALILRRRQRGDDTIALTPSVPDRERCFPGLIVSEASHTGTGGYLVAGPGVLASTVDPTGASFRHEVSPGLTPIRVRPPYWTDPVRADYGGRSLVLECEDEGVRVLVVTHRKHMPRVLGALQTMGRERKVRR